MTANQGSLLTYSNLFGKHNINQERIRRLLDARESPPGYSRNQFSISLPHPHTYDI